MLTSEDRMNDANQKARFFLQGAPARYEEVIPDIPAGSPTSTAESL